MCVCVCVCEPRYLYMVADDMIIYDMLPYSLSLSLPLSRSTCQQKAGATIR